MKLYQFALKNLMRSKTRTMLTILSVMVATTTIFVVLSLDRGYQTAVNEELVKDTGIHIFITREGCPIEAASVIAHGGISPLYIPEGIGEKAKEVEFVQEVMPFKIYAITTPDGLRTDIFFGVTEAIQRIRPEWNLREGSWFKDKNSVILGAEIARVEMLKPGDKVYFEHFDRKFEVTGVLERNFTQDDGFFFLPLATAQKLINREGKLSAIAINLETLDHLEDVKITMEGILPEDYFVITAKALGAGVLKFFGSTRAMMFMMVFVALIVCTLGIVNTMLMAAAERRKEFAYLKCVGAGFFDITRLIFLETLIISLIGVVLGLTISLLMVPGFEDFIRRFLVVYVPAARIVRPGVDIAILSSLIVVFVGIFAALYPAIKAANISPMEAIRNE
jgi:putative ABC transport system permease protein